MERPTPLAFPLLVDRAREQVTSEKLGDRVRRMAAPLERAAGTDPLRAGEPSRIPERRMSDVMLTIAGEDVQLLPERALYWPRACTLVVADVHWGKAATFRAAGIPIPSGTTTEDLARLDQRDSADRRPPPGRAGRPLPCQGGPDRHPHPGDAPRMARAH